MSLKKYFLKNKFTYKIYLYYNLYFRHKIFLKKTQYSQWGEDLFIIQYFQNKKRGIYLDIGCFHPLMYSNTCLLYKQGWQGINIDINLTAIDLFNIARPKDFNICTTIDQNKKEYKVFFDHHFSPLNTLSESNYRVYKKKYFKDASFKRIKSNTIDEILNLTNMRDINFLNIDVEGFDFQILKQLIPKKINPELISIETHDVDGSKLLDCDKINELLIQNNFITLKRVGPTTLFQSKH